MRTRETPGPGPRAHKKSVQFRLPCLPAVPTEFKVDRHFYDAMLLEQVIYDIRMGFSLYRIKWGSAHDRFRIRLTKRLQAIHHKNDVN